MDILKDKKHIHFIGIGGSGMFPLVQILNSEGYYITGSDNNQTETLDMVRNLGIKVFIDQKSENIQGADLIIHTAAIMDDNEELIAAKESEVLVIERSELLGFITKRYNNAICISGTHGKTTTSSMITQILYDAKIDPTVVIGGNLKSIGGNGRKGNSDIMVCEACEFVNTFLKLYPDITIILNIDEDHMDYFKTMDNLINSFRSFAKLTTKTLIVNGDDENVLKAVENIEKQIITFGFGKQNQYYPDNIKILKGLKTTYDLINNGKKVCEITLYVPGAHNIINSVSAFVASILAGVSPSQIVDGLKAFKGAVRRFEFLGEYNGITVVDDYAHHPAEIKVTLEAAKTMGFNSIWAVHQPFTYSRTSLLLDEFANVLNIADRVLLTPIMGSREKNNYDIHSKDLAEKIPNSKCFETFEDICNYVKQNAKNGDLIITLGCGDVYKIAKMILQ